ncbi:hypothetical protein LUZ61_003232 [Rhynchospora tenuis]|uniref:Uncharacterized protein n=1 Tax=Rhynchospora tenuis TaxID=198213 RepID=A0AAD5ZKE8_9POAL|nr:hypothetical protein LUZ61_003232 [Rhynchospora tenuis]
MVTSMSSLWEIGSRVNLGSLSRTPIRHNQVGIRHWNQNAILFYAPKNNRCTMILATPDGNSPSITESKLSEQTNTEEKPQNNDESAPPSANSKRPPLTARERLRAARVLSKYTEPNSKPSKSEFGSKVLDAIRETDKGKRKGSRLPEAPTNLFDDSKRGLPDGKWTFNIPFGSSDVLVIVFSFLLIITLMFATTYFVWKVGAIHFNEY